MNELPDADDISIPSSVDDTTDTETVPVGELQELVRAFRIGGEMSDVPLPSGREKGRSETFEICADELSELIDKHTNE